MVAIPCQSFLFNFLQFDQPWSSLIEGDEDCIGPIGELLCLWQTPQIIRHMNFNFQTCLIVGPLRLFISFY